MIKSCDNCFISPICLVINSLNIEAVDKIKRDIDENTLTVKYEIYESIANECGYYINRR